MRKAWEITQLVFVALMLSVAFFGLWRVWNAVATSVKSTKDFWDVLTAIGTCAAVVVALFIANSQSRRQRLDEIARARVVAASLYHKIFNAYSDVHKIQRALNAGIEAGIQEQEYAKLLTDLRAVRLDVTTEQLVAICPIRNNAAVKLAQAMDQVRTVIKIMEREQSRLSFRGDPRVNRELLQMMNAFCSSPLSLLSDAAGECQIAALGLNYW